MLLKRSEGRRPAAPPAPARGERVLLASEGRPIPAEALDRAAELATRDGHVHVFTVARVWGSGLGLPNPGLLPNRDEWQAQRDVVRDAVEGLERRGIEVTGHVLATRRATKRIVGEASRLGCTAIVMAADPPRNRVVADLMWSQEPHRVRRRARMPVHLTSRGAASSS